MNEIFFESKKSYPAFSKNLVKILLLPSFFNPQLSLMRGGIPAEFNKIKHCFHIKENEILEITNERELGRYIHTLLEEEAYYPASIFLIILAKHSKNLQMAVWAYINLYKQVKADGPLANAKIAAECADKIYSFPLTILFTTKEIFHWFQVQLYAHHSVELALEHERNRISFIWARKGLNIIRKYCAIVGINTYASPIEIGQQALMLQEALAQFHHDFLIRNFTPEDTEKLNEFVGELKEVLTILQSYAEYNRVLEFPLQKDVSAIAAMPANTIEQLITKRKKITELDDIVAGRNQICKVLFQAKIIAAEDKNKICPEEIIKQLDDMQNAGYLMLSQFLETKINDFLQHHAVMRPQDKYQLFNDLQTDYKLIYEEMRFAQQQRLFSFDIEKLNEDYKVFCIHFSASIKPQLREDLIKQGEIFLEQLIHMQANLASAQALPVAEIEALFKQYQAVFQQVIFIKESLQELGLDIKHDFFSKCVLVPLSKILNKYLAFYAENIDACIARIKNKLSQESILPKESVLSKVAELRRYCKELQEINELCFEYDIAIKPVYQEKITAAKQFYNFAEALSKNLQGRISQLDNISLESVSEISAYRSSLIEIKENLKNRNKLCNSLLDENLITLEEKLLLCQGTSVEFEQQIQAHEAIYLLKIKAIVDQIKQEATAYLTNWRTEEIILHVKDKFENFKQLECMYTEFMCALDLYPSSEMMVCFSEINSAYQSIEEFFKKNIKEPVIKKSTRIVDLASNLICFAKEDDVVVSIKNLRDYFDISQCVSEGNIELKELSYFSVVNKCLSFFNMDEDFFHEFILKQFSIREKFIEKQTRYVKNIIAENDQSEAGKEKLNFETERLRSAYQQLKEINDVFLKRAPLLEWRENESFENFAQQEDESRRALNRKFPEDPGFDLIVVEMQELIKMQKESDFSMAEISKAIKNAIDCINKFITTENQSLLGRAQVSDPAVTEMQTPLAVKAQAPLLQLKNMWEEVQEVRYQQLAGKIQQEAQSSTFTKMINEFTKDQLASERLQKLIEAINQEYTTTSDSVVSGPGMFKLVRKEVYAELLKDYQDIVAALPPRPSHLVSPSA